MNRKIARNEGIFSVARDAPTLPVFNVGPKSVFSFAKTVHENCVLWHFPGICCISESTKKLQKLSGSALSHSIIRRLKKNWVWAIGPQDAEMAFRLCTFVGAHLAPPSFQTLPILLPESREELAL